jgi:hypothetical protein
MGGARRNAWRHGGPTQKVEGKKPTGKPRLQWVDNIKMDLEGGIYFIHLIQDRTQWWIIVNTAINCRCS